MSDQLYVVGGIINKPLLRRLRKRLFFLPLLLLLVLPYVFYGLFVFVFCFFGNFDY